MYYGVWCVCVTAPEDVGMITHYHIRPQHVYYILHYYHYYIMFVDYDIILILLTFLKKSTKIEVIKKITDKKTQKTHSQKGRGGMVVKWEN